MRGKIAAAAIVVGLAVGSRSAGAMNAPEQALPHCKVIGGDKLPAASGGPEALCKAIEQAAAARAPGVAYSAEVRVVAPSVLVATLTTADGRKLPEQKYAVMDRAITRSSFQRFAEAIAAALGKAESR
jgi:hypothetical protein